MRVPTYIQFKSQLDSMSRQSEEVESLSQKINTGKKLINSSDDPILAQRIKSTQDYINQINAYEHNTATAQNRATAIEGSIQSSLEGLDRIKELIKSAQSDTASSSDRANIVKELRGLLKNQASYANTKDSLGEYLFSGTSSTTVPFGTVNGVYQYFGSKEAAMISISPTLNQTYTESGQTVFGDIRLGNGDFVINEGSTPNTGTAETSTGEITDRTNYIEDTYTLTFVTNSNGRVGYQVVGATTGQVIPAPPLTTPADAPDYQSKDAITFNGLSLSISGDPNAGDAFVISPAGNQNVLETINQLINAIGMPIANNVDKAKYHQQLNQLGAAVDRASEHLTNYLSDIGYRAATIDTEVTANATIVQNQTAILSNLSNANLEQVIPEYKQKMLSLELTGESYNSLQSLFTQILKSSF